MAGGFVDDKFTLDYIKKEKYDKSFAVDRGLGFFQRTGLVPDYIVGDFDSVEAPVLEAYEKLEVCEKPEVYEKSEVYEKPEVYEKLEAYEKPETCREKRPQIVRLNPMKDDTDTEHALHMALDMDCDSIHIFGGTGTRLDHVLGNLQLLGYALRRQAECMMLDPCNRIRLIDRETVLEKEKQFGTYISLIPYTPQVTGLTLEGFLYPLKHHTMSSFYLKDAAPISGVSNEIVAEQARISMDEGILVLVESRDA